MDIDGNTALYLVVAAIVLGVAVLGWLYVSLIRKALNVMMMLAGILSFFFLLLLYPKFTVLGSAFAALVAAAIYIGNMIIYG